MSDAAPDIQGDDAPQHEETDAELIARSAEQPRAFMQVVHRHQRVLFGYLARRVGGDAAEDIVSETFARAFAQRDRYDQTRADARPWLFGIAANLMRGRARSEARRYRAYARHGADEREHHDPDETHRRLDAQVRQPELAAAIEQLSPGDREVLLLFAWGDQSYEEIATALDIPVGTVRSRLNRARRKVKEQLEAAGIEDPDDVNPDPTLGEGSPAGRRGGTA